MFFKIVCIIRKTQRPFKLVIILIRMLWDLCLAFLSSDTVCQLTKSTFACLDITVKFFFFFCGHKCYTHFYLEDCSCFPSCLIQRKPSAAQS